MRQQRRLVVDGEIVWPRRVSDGLYTFVLDRKSAEIRLASRSAIPAEFELQSTDTRRLGVCIEGIVLRDDYLRMGKSPTPTRRCAKASTRTREPSAGPTGWVSCPKRCCILSLTA